MARPPRIPVMLPWECKAGLTNHTMHAKNGDGSRAALTAFFELRNQFTKSGTTFERIQFELVWSRTGASGHTRKVLPTTSRSWIGRGTLESCRAFVPNAMSLI